MLKVFLCKPSITMKTMDVSELCFSFKSLKQRIMNIKGSQICVCPCVVVPVSTSNIFYMFWITNQTDYEYFDFFLKFLSS